jgi:hypothetical protein
MSESIVAVFAIVVILCFVFGIMSKQGEDPRDSTSGRWGIKTGKFVSGDWGGENWGEKRKK